MSEETKRKLITLPIKLESRTYRVVKHAYYSIVAIIMIALACVFIAGVCWFIVN